MAPILKMIPDCQLVVEELYGAVLHTVLRSHDQQAVALDSPLEQRRPVSQVRNRCPDVRTRGLGGERGGILRDGGREQRLDGRPDAIDDGAQIGGLVALRLAQLFQRRGHRAALGVAHDHSEPRPEHLGRKLDAPHLRWRDDVAGDPDHEQVTEALAKDELRWNAGVGAPEHDGERLLPRARTATRSCSVFYEAAASPAQRPRRFSSPGLRLGGAVSRAPALPSPRLRPTTSSPLSTPPP